jgi:hypothetical protein
LFPLCGIKIKIKNKKNMPKWRFNIFIYLTYCHSNTFFPEESTSFVCAQLQALCFNSWEINTFSSLMTESFFTVSTNS